MTVLLVLLGVVVAASTVTLLAGMIRLGRRSDGGSGPAALTDVMEAAFLGGGPGRVADAALAEMRADGRLTIGGPGIVLVRQAVSRHPVEDSVLREHAAAPTGALRALRLAVMRSLPVQAIGDTLAARGLLLRPEATRPWRKWALFHALGCLVALPVSIGMSVAANLSESDQATGPWPGLAVTAVVVLGLATGLACSATLVKKRVTGAGQHALRQFQESRSDVSTAHLVAAHGPRALPDPVLRRQLQMAARPLRGNRGSARRTVSAGQAVSTAATSGPVVWCAGSDPGSGSGCGAGGSGSCGGSSGSGCGSSGGSGCGGSSGSGCGGSSGNSCGGGSSSCGGGGSSCGGSN